MADTFETSLAFNGTPAEFVAAVDVFYWLTLAGKSSAYFDTPR